jgi:serine/threonine-protein kinase RsbW
LNQRELLMKLELRSNPDLLCAVRAAMEALTARMGFSGTECRSVTRAVDEALTNIIRHAYAGTPDQPIELSCFRATGSIDGRTGEGLEIVLEDYGIPADLEKMHSRPLEVLRPGGLGLHYIRESMDQMEYSRSGSTNRLRLWKNLRPAQSGPST